SFQLAPYEVTNAQYAVFLNDAQLDQNHTERSVHMVFGADGQAKLPSGEALFQPGNVAPSSAHIRYQARQPLGLRYVVDSGYESFPVTNVSWFGAAKFCNWLSLRKGIASEQRCYTEGDSGAEWHPATISTADWAIRDLSPGERQDLLALGGFRLPMD